MKRLRTCFAVKDRKHGHAQRFRGFGMTLHRRMTNSSAPILNLLAERQMLAQVTNPERFPLPCGDRQQAIGSETVGGQKTSVYFGIDPTADGLHLGNLMGLLVLKWFMKSGYRAIVLVGGATGLIGDPSFRNQERELVEKHQVLQNMQGIKRDVDLVLGAGKQVSGSKDYIIVDNHDWFQTISAVDFLRDIGTQFRVNNLLSRESMKARAGDAKSGLSFTELSYQLFQAYDFYWLKQHYNCRIQIGGSDQWGNIISGIEYVRRRLGHDDEKTSNSLEEGFAPVFGVTVPLLTDKAGTKFGKSGANPVWLNDRKTSVFDLHNYLVSTSDDQVEKLLLYLTDLPVATISEVMQTHSISPKQRVAQRRLVRELVSALHGSEAYENIYFATSKLFPSSKSHANNDQLITGEEIEALLLSAQVPVLQISLEDLSSQVPASLCVRSQLTNSKTEAKKLARNRGLFLNNRAVTEAEASSSIPVEKLVDGKYLILRAGKKKLSIIDIKPCD